LWHWEISGYLATDKIIINKNGHQTMSLQQANYLDDATQKLYHFSYGNN
jgi:hypothetical protein